MNPLDKFPFKITHSRLEIERSNLFKYLATGNSFEIVYTVVDVIIYVVA